MDKRITPDLPREITPYHSIADRCRIWADWIDAGLVGGNIQARNEGSWYICGFPDMIPSLTLEYKIDPRLIEPDKPLVGEMMCYERMPAIELTPEVRARLSPDAGVDWNSIMKHLRQSDGTHAVAKRCRDAVRAAGIDVD